MIQSPSPTQGTLHNVARLTPARVEAFSDGVFSIAATLLVLELKVPQDLTHGLRSALLAQWPSYVAFATSFVSIGVIWVNHHALFTHVRHTDRSLLFVNLLLLMVVSVLPFPTALLGQYVMMPDGGTDAAILYGAVGVALSLAFTWLRAHIVGLTQKVDSNVDAKRARREAWIFGSGLAGYLLGIVVSFFSPLMAMAVYGLIVVFYVYPWIPERA